MPTYVYQLVATFIDPMVGGDTIESFSTTVFKSPENAQARSDTMKAAIRRRFKVAEDYPIEVHVKPFEVIDD